MLWSDPLLPAVRHYISTLDTLVALHLQRSRSEHCVYMFVNVYMYVHMCVYMCVCVCVHVCVHVCLCMCLFVSAPRLSITSNMVCIPYDWLSKFYSFYITAVVSIVSRRGLTIDVHCRNQSSKSKLAMYNLFLSL